VTRTLFLLFVLTPLASAAPVPKATIKKLSDVYGTEVDPSSPCKCEMVGGDKLRVVVPNTHRPAETEHPNTVPPLVTKSVEGDFVVIVRVSHSYSKSAGKAEGAKKQTEVAAGIALLGEGSENVRFTFVHRQTKTGDKWVSGRYAQVMHRGGGSGSGSGGAKLDESPVFLRLTRKDESLKCETSADGTKWQPFSTLTAKGLGPLVNIGPVAFQSSDAEYAAEFDKYEIKPLTEEKK
jgi:hypothetical protein